jgi:hypothetical protein
MTGSPAHHNLFSYDDDARLVDQVAPFLAAGLAQHEAVVIVVDPRKRAVLTEALGALARHIDYAGPGDHVQARGHLAGAPEPAAASVLGMRMTRLWV